jgi:hypothetical protein
MLKSNSGNRSKSGIRTALAGVLSVAAITATCLPVAAADGPLEPAACAASSTVMGALAKEFAEKAGRLKGLAVLAAAAGAGAGCLPALKSLQDGKPADFDIRTPKGGTISRRMTLQDFETNLLADRGLQISRKLQCGGWKVPEFYQACLRYDLDPIYH